LALTSGARLGPYEIISALGAGGMREVYRARDTKLNRGVAIKVLHDLFASDTDRLARFTRQACTLEALKHPDIAQIYGLEESGGVHALMMELRGRISLTAHRGWCDPPRRGAADDAH
jgi:serine/threonine protein kinase